MEISNKTLVLFPSQITLSKTERKKNSRHKKLYIYAVTLAALLSAVGVLWDISWHASVGRDQFLTPPHILIYLGAIFGGLFSAIQVLINTFISPAEKKGSFVKVWGIFYASLGSLFCIWGAIAMLTSHRLIIGGTVLMGLDVKVFSPPHACCF